MSDQGDKIGDALARSLDPEADAAKRAIWRRVAGVLAGAFQGRFIDVLDDPTAVTAYMPDGGWCYPQTVAWELDPATKMPIALWVKVAADEFAWERIWPAVGEGDHKFAIDSEDESEGGAEFADKKLEAGTGMSLAKVTGSHGKALQINCTVSPGPSKSTLLPLPDGDEAILGNEGKWADGQHVHPKTRPAKIRYYLTDTARVVGSGDFLLATENPYDEANAVDLEHTTGHAYWLQFASPEGSPGLAVWSGGSIRVHLRLKMTNPQNGRTYKLYTGNGDIVYTAMVWDWTHSDTYQVKPSAPEQPTVITTYADLEFDVPVAALAAGADARLGLNLRLRVYVGNDEATFADEHLIVRVGGDNASYLDTLFTPDGGFSGVHNDLDGREATGAHPSTAVSTSASNFQGSLSPSDTNVQLALDTLSKRQSCRYYLGGSFATPVLSRFPSQTAWTSGVLTITTTSTLIMTMATTGCDPGLVVAPAGHHIIRLAVAANSIAQLLCVVKVGSETVAQSAWTTVPLAGGICEIIAVSVEPHADSVAITDVMSIEVFALCPGDEGYTTNLTILSGGDDSSTVVSPWLSETWLTAHQADPMVNRGFAAENRWGDSFHHPASAVCFRLPYIANATIDADGILTVPMACSGPVRVSGSELKGIRFVDSGGPLFGVLTSLCLHFVEACTVRHLATLTGDLAEFSVNLDLLPSQGTPATDYDRAVVAKGTMRLYLDEHISTPSGLAWYREVES